MYTYIICVQIKAQYTVYEYHMTKSLLILDNHTVSLLHSSFLSKEAASATTR